MKTIEKEKALRSDLSPAVSLEDKRRHDLEAEKFNYRIALSELSFYKEHSKHAFPGRDPKSEHAWTDHQGQVWLTENPISPAARKEMEMVLAVIRGYESKLGEMGREKQALDEIANVRVAGREPVPSRLAGFEKHDTKPDPFEVPMRTENELMPQHGIEVER